MKLRILIIIFFLNFTHSYSSSENLDENIIHKNLRCLVCQGQSIADSNSDFAQTLKAVVKDLVEQGKSEEEMHSWIDAIASALLRGRSSSEPVC